MNSLTRIMSYDKTKINQENCNCEECVSVKNVESDNQITEYPKLSDEEIEQIIFERYSDKDDKTKTFIRKALRKHGDRYDYSNVIYTKATVNVEIICRVEGHEPFPQTPNNHLSGKGCKKCGFEKLANERKLTLEEFIEEGNATHGIGRYDYSKVKYVNNDTNVIIICHNHDIPFEFKQKPKHHLSGHGCKKCADEKLAEIKTLTLEEFIEKANEKQGLGTYDYSKVNYVGTHIDVIITCPKHGDFPQTPSNHLKGEGCLKCGIEKVAKSHMLTLEEFIERANKIHGLGTYDYSKVNYININTEVIITCPKHGDFPQTPTNHLQGHGCWKCASEKLAELFRLTKEEFIEKANEKHGEGTYDYSKVNYVNYDTEVIITCPKHGDFPQTPSSHLNGSGCPKCNNYKGEIAIRNFLTECKIEFEEQKKFDDCKDKLRLPFDFYVPIFNLCIEFDGEGHFKPIKRSKKMTDEQAEENLNYVQRHDKIKNDYCEKNKINLLRLNNLKTVNEELAEYFQNL